MANDIDYVDVTENGYDKDALRGKTMVFMPDIDYGLLDRLEELSNEDTKLITVPITLPVMDIISQLDYAGIQITSEQLESLRCGIRNTIIKAIRFGGEMTTNEEDN